MNASQKNLVTLLAATVVAGGLGLYAYFGVMKPEEEEVQRKQAEATLFPVNAPEAGGTDGGAPPALRFTWVSVELPHSKTEMELQEGVWRVTSPVSALAEKTQVDNLIGELAAAKFKATIEENPTDADLERYGLKPPRATVTARAYVPDAQGGGKDDPSRQHSVTFYLGIENRFDGTAYLRREGDPRVYSAGGALRFALQKTTAEWRDRQVFPLEESSLLRIEVKASRNAFTLERATTDKPWQLTQPLALRAAPQRVARMVSDLRFRRILSFPRPEEGEEKARKAMEQPLVDATFVPKIGTPLRLRLAEVPLAGAKQTFAMTEWGSEVMLGVVDRGTINDLDVPPLDFKDKKVLAVQARDVRGLIVHPAAGGETLTLVKVPDTQRWEVEAPLHGLAREFKVASLLNSLEKLEAAAITEANPKNWARYGISDTSRGVSLMDGGGQLIARLRIGNPVKGNPQRVWARGSSEDVLELDKSALDALPLTLTDLLDAGPAANSAP
ncbi:DUF4340 domain-containing protein [Archangium violaceum]|uniref:DUF4340 domain-containing protein n=1 Tax=Archangium violaceum TaxID=83451 RepID=UPI00193BF3ED|nr:DUF4340 domain-containing protein [Archangium violaceum]QRK05152.1 DUF4340 domain-containing protein [Archangium violaceum]